MILEYFIHLHPFPMKYLSKSGPEFGKPKNVADVASEFDAGDGTGASRPDVLTRQSQQARLNPIHPSDPQMTEFAIFNLMISNEHTHTHVTYIIYLYVIIYICI